MTTEAQQELFSFLTQEFGVTALHQDMAEIENIVLRGQECDHLWVNVVNPIGGKLVKKKCMKCDKVIFTNKQP
jgi:hypothetical protein